MEEGDGEGDGEREGEGNMGRIERGLVVMRCGCSLPLCGVLNEETQKGIGSIPSLM